MPPSTSATRRQRRRPVAAAVAASSRCRRPSRVATHPASRPRGAARCPRRHRPRAVFAFPHHRPEATTGVDRRAPLPTARSAHPSHVSPAFEVERLPRAGEWRAFERRYGQVAAQQSVRLRPDQHGTVVPRKPCARHAVVVQQPAPLPMHCVSRVDCGMGGKHAGAQPEVCEAQRAAGKRRAENHHLARMMRGVEVVRRPILPRNQRRGQAIEFETGAQEHRAARDARMPSRCRGTVSLVRSMPPVASSHERAICSGLYR